MSPHPAPRPRSWSRRAFLAAVGLAAGGARPAFGYLESTADGEPRLVGAPSESHDPPTLRVPAFTHNGAKVPLTIEASHPMDPSHYVTRVSVVSERDPVPLKGVFHFTPLNGQVYLAFQIRLNGGASEVRATAECTRHVRWQTAQSVTIPDGAGGCVGTAPPPARLGEDEFGPPVIRIPQLIAEGRLRPGQIIDVQVKIKHPSRTGLALRDGAFVKAGEPLHLTGLDVHYGDVRVSRFALTSALSDNPFITFRLSAHVEDVLRVSLTNNRGERFEAARAIHFA